MRFDEIGYWSELKLEIVEKYAKAYSTILSARTEPTLHHAYIDAFSGAGIHLSKTTGQLVRGSPLKALEVTPPFKEYFFIDLDGDKVAALQSAVGNRPDVHIFHGDSNEILLEEVLPLIRYEAYRRGLCLLDPYGLDLNWEVIEATGKMGSIDLFLNLPIMDMNRNALWRIPEAVSTEQATRMTAFWGDETWKDVAYKPSSQLRLFGGSTLEKQGNRAIADAFRRRLKDVAGFPEVPEPLPMRNSKRVIVYYLFFASQKSVALKIVKDIFDAYRDRED